jgi:NRAMP (natural resistance-associated macrophage protein)-like metal ion transporter
MDAFYTLFRYSTKKTIGIWYHVSIPTTSIRMDIKRFLKRLGPGFITGAADDDPSGIATYAQTGAQFGFGQLWTALFSFPFMTAVQEMCGRIGLVTGEGLSTVIRNHYSRLVLYAAVGLLLIANTINIGADLGAMASSAQLILGMPFWFWLIFLTVLTLFLEIFVSYPRYAKFLKYLTLSLFAYVIAALVIKQDWMAVLHATFVPTFTWNHSYIMNIVAVLGTTISPYLFFWQADEEVEEEMTLGLLSKRGRPKMPQGALKTMRIDTVLGMFFSNLVMFFVIVTSAVALRSQGITSVETATQAAAALRPFAGPYASLLFALGIVGTGMLAVPILAGSASYAVAEAVGWNGGLYRKLRDARGFYAVITVSTLIGLLVNLFHIPPFKMLYYTALLNGVVAPPLLLLILLIANNKKIMGKHVNGRWSNTLGIIVTLVMTLAVIALFIG